MKDYTRSYPLFSLCGLNCGLCPRHQTSGKSKCPGCGGKDFYLLHPSCAIVTCSKKHGNIEYCFLCEKFPCEEYPLENETDSFITYQNVINDMRKAKAIGIEKYQSELNEKISFLEHLIKIYNDGRKKQFYCIAVNLLTLEELYEVKKVIQSFDEKLDQKEKILKIVSLFNEKAKARNITLKIRKQ